MNKEWREFTYFFTLVIRWREDGGIIRQKYLAFAFFSLSLLKGKLHFFISEIAEKPVPQVGGATLTFFPLRLDLFPSGPNDNRGLLKGSIHFRGDIEELRATQVQNGPPMTTITPPIKLQITVENKMHRHKFAQQLTENHAARINYKHVYKMWTD